ncbi:M23 family metallopeptidase [Mucilaginibacter agri]|uniref:Peptidoglycan DD-metalloendopeptidase family protein n=1 Tax=Mucilaginibacter agri TaxID=2695265 RepID=A0A965ZEP1_9SPHI|nr:M23 family metallopeptidase [Mucilaginibacter agri]NCD68301.1 peptidoglycan DD-metalloendopeptidase family protein [Mucilaginibacter agri]
MRTAAGLWIICLPLLKLSINSSFGYRLHPLTGKYAFHNGVDFKARSDTVFAMMDGTVAAVAYDDLSGTHIRIDHGNGITSVSGHLSHVLVLPGEEVIAGQPIAITGKTGRITGEHLHFSLYLHQRCVDPLEFIYQAIKNNKHHE